MSKPAQKYKNNAIFKQNYAKKLKMVYPRCFGLRGNLDFSDFLQKKFYNINYGLAALKTFGLSKVHLLETVSALKMARSVEIKSLQSNSFNWVRKNKFEKCSIFLNFRLSCG